MRRFGLRYAASLSLCLVASVAHADVKSAAEQFDAGRRAYKAGDFPEAARSFEAAYLDAPNPEALRSAIVARQKAKQLPRAATLAAFAERAHPEDAALAAVGKDVRAAARPTLGVFVVSCTPKCSLAVDGQVGSLTDDTTVSVYLEPGPHKVSVEWPDKRSRAFDVEAAAGATRSETVEQPAAEPAAAVVVAPVPAQRPTPPTPVAPEPSRKPLPKGVFFIAAGLTVAAGAGTLVSGILTLNSPGKEAVRRDCAGLGTDCETYKKGQNAELRTNILLGTTIGLGVVTTAIAFFTDFSGHSRGKARATPFYDPVTRSAGLGVAGRF